VKMEHYLVLETDADKKEEPEGCVRLIFPQPQRNAFPLAEILLFL